MQDGSCPWTAFLDEVTSSDSKHYLWLRALSYLEYIGYRKMVKALGYENVNKGVFHHLTDEIQHSFMLGELAEKNYGILPDAPAFTDRYRQIAESYFQAIDQHIHNMVVAAVGKEDSYLCYILVSWVIEKRAMAVYPPYFNRLQEAPSKYIIQKILRDESEHLSYLEGKMATLPQISKIIRKDLLSYEDSQFTAMLGNLQESFLKVAC